MKIHPVEAKLFHVGGRLDWQTWWSQQSHFATSQTPKNQSAFILR